MPHYRVTVEEKVSFDVVVWGDTEEEAKSRVEGSPNVRKEFPIARQEATWEVTDVKPG